MIQMETLFYWNYLRDFVKVIVIIIRNIWYSGARIVFVLQCFDKVWETVIKKRKNNLKNKDLRGNVYFSEVVRLIYSFALNVHIRLGRSWKVGANGRRDVRSMIHHRHRMISQSYIACRRVVSELTTFFYIYLYVSYRSSVYEDWNGVSATK